MLKLSMIVNQPWVKCVKHISRSFLNLWKSYGNSIYTWLRVKRFLEIAWEIPDKYRNSQFRKILWTIWIDVNWLMFRRFVKNSPYQILSFSPLFNNLNFSTIAVMTILILLYLSVFMLRYLRRSQFQTVFHTYYF